MNTNYTIPAFAEPITSLPDTPTCAAAELKRRFQAPADEVREAHNALAEAHETLDEKVEGIVTETFAGTIHENMFDEELAEKFNGKADQTSLDSAVQNITTQDSRLSAVEAALPGKVGIVTGSYTGTDTYARTITLGFAPKGVIICHADGFLAESSATYSTMAVQGVSNTFVTLLSNGFQLNKDSQNHNCLNYSKVKFSYIAFQ